MIAVVVGGFLCGSVPYGLVFARVRGIDLRTVGSGNIGATNAARALGRKLGVLVLLCDAAKAALPMLLARRVCAGDPRVEWAVAATGVAAFLGHVYSPWLRGKGGKGVASGLGVFLVLSPIAAAVAAGVWALVYGLTRLSSLGSLIATTAILPTLALLHAPPAHLAAAGLLYVIILLRHRENIRRLLRREETKV
jgi:glycerol-3-phosphate acyltransferase PlsY